MKKKLTLLIAGVVMTMGLTGCNYVKLCEYTGVEATKVVYDVTDEEVQEEIEYVMYDYVTYDTVTNRGVEEGDYANITYTATIDGEANEDYSMEEEDIMVGEGWSYPELEEALIGMETGDTTTVEVTLTEEFVEEDLVGKVAVLEVTLNEITVENIPEYNLEFVKENFEFETLEEYEASVKEELLATKEEDYKYAAVEEIFQYIIEHSEFDGYPKDLYEECEEMYNSNNEFYASMYGLEVEDYLEMLGVDEETKKEEIIASVNYELVIQEIAKKENIDASDEEVDAYIESIYAEYGYETVDEFLEDYTKDQVRSELIYIEVSEFLYENAKLIEISEEEYLAEQEALYESYYSDEEEDIELEDEDSEEEATKIGDEVDVDELEETEEEESTEE